MGRPRVVWLGLRGFPNIQGGVETHAEHICPRLVANGCDVAVIGRNRYLSVQLVRDGWNGVRFKSIWAPRHKGLEAIVHSILGALYAGLVLRPDILHIQAIGPAIVTPLARLLGLRVVVTHHGADYDRQKWGPIAKVVLSLGERAGMRFSNQRIVISNVIRRLVQDKHARDSVLIPNGVSLPQILLSTKSLQSFGLESGNYVLLVSRLVPEKRHLDLIEGFAKANLSGWKLVIVGAADHPDSYSKEVESIAAACASVVCTGFQQGIALQELYAHAGIFVLPSSHEGLPIAILEALSYGLPVVASDIPANLEIGLLDRHYFKLGNTDELATRLVEFAREGKSVETMKERCDWIKQRYDWDRIAAQTAEVYRGVLID